MIRKRVPGAVGTRSARYFTAASSQYMRAESGFGIGPTDPFWIGMLCDTASPLSSSGAFLGATIAAVQSRGMDIYSGSVIAPYSYAAGYVAGATQSWSATDRWTLFLVDFPGVSSRNVYVTTAAGVDRASNATTTSTLSTAPTITVFGAYPGPAQYHGGPMARGMVGRGTAPGAAQRRALARGAHPLSLSLTGIVECWDLDRLGPIRGHLLGTLLNPVNRGSLVPGPMQVQGPPHSRRVFVGAGAAPVSTARSYTFIY